MARVWAGWGLSQLWYRDGLFRTLGFETVDEFLIGFWEERFLLMDANNLLNQLWTWQNSDLSATPGFDGSLTRALGAIRARAFVVPGERDLYFPQEDSAWEVDQLQDAELRVIPGLWGHFSDLGLDDTCSDFVRATVGELLRD
jgi:homoserine O-acetyltransferase